MLSDGKRSKLKKADVCLRVQVSNKFGFDLSFDAR